MKAEKTGYYNVKTEKYQNVQHLTEGEEIDAKIEFIGEELPPEIIPEPVKINVSDHDIDSYTDEQIEKLKIRLGLK